MTPFIEGLLGAGALGALTTGISVVYHEYKAWRARRDLAAKRVLDALSGDNSAKHLEYYREMMEQMQRIKSPPTYITTAAGTSGSVPGVIWPITSTGGPTSITNTGWAA